MSFISSFLPSLREFALAHHEYWTEHSVPDAVTEVAQEAFDLLGSRVASVDQARSYWREHSLLQGYSESMNGVAYFIQRFQNKRQDSNFARALDGVAMGPLRVFGAIPSGILQWEMESVRDGMHEGVLSGLGTFLSGPFKGIWEGTGFVGNQLVNWSRGSLRGRDSFEVADEVSTTICMAVLVVTGVFRNFRGGANLISDFQHTEPVLVPVSNGSSAAGVAVSPVAPPVSGLGNPINGIVVLSAQKSGGTNRPPPETPNLGRIAARFQKRVGQRLGLIDVLVLTDLFLTGSTYGVELINRIQQRTGFSVSQATLSPLLRRLEEVGILSSESVVSQTGGRPRIIYSLTAYGRTMAETLLEALKHTFGF